VVEKSFKKIIVSLKEQSVTAFDGEKLFHRCECVSGDSDHPTPKGTFEISRKEHPYRSKKYDVQMDYAQFFHGGVALHQYHGPAPWFVLRAGRSITDAIGSHGCVRLQESDAKLLYNWTTRTTDKKRGTKVEVK
jgi:lipoprotein-anchoring transpeptidase ErfK/SrfK